MTSSVGNLIPVKEISPPQKIKLLARDSNTKLRKTAEGQPIVLAGMSMMPDEKLCPSSGNAECFKPCLKESGLAQVFSSINDARQRKTDYYHSGNSSFLAQLRKELGNLEKYAVKQDKQPVVRLNVLSDVAWEQHNIPQEFPNIFFYDYTKRADRINRTPFNYRLMFSYSAAPKYKKQVRIALGTNVPIAVVFRNGLPSEFLGREVIDGDKSDLENLKARGKIVGLRLKGNEAKKSNSPFIVDALTCNLNSFAA